MTLFIVVMRVVKLIKVVVVRWIEGNSIDEFLKKLLAALPAKK
jgi:ABC-type Zn2+ transport system substrate-binding protein/surface adhesin